MDDPGPRFTALVEVYHGLLMAAVREERRRCANLALEWLEPGNVKFLHGDPEAAVRFIVAKIEGRAANE